MPRPTTVTVLEAYQLPNGNVEMWVDFGGTLVHCAFPKWELNIADKKLIYGFAHLEVDGTLEETGHAAPRLVDHSADADLKALAACFADHLDTWEFYGVPIGGSETGSAPMKPSEVKAKAASQPDLHTHPYDGWTQRTDLHGPHDVPAKALARSPYVIVNTKEKA